MKQKFSFRYILILLGMCGLLGTNVGLCTNVAGLFFTPIAEDFGILTGSVSMTLTICNLVFAVSGLLAPKVIKETSFRTILIAATVLVAGSTALMSMCNNIALLYILNAIRGFAGGLTGFVLVTTVINSWFVDFNGLATSIAMSFSGIAGAVFSPIVSGIIQANGWRTGYLFIALVMVIFNLPSILFLPCLKPETKGMKPLGERKVSAGTSASAAGSGSVNGLLFAMVIVFAIICCGSTSLPQFFPGISGSYGMAASVGAGMLSVSMITNTASKIVLGAMIDKFGSRISILSYIVAVIFGIASILLIRAPFMMFVAAGCMGLAYALGTVAIAMMAKDVFGAENYSRTYPVCSMAGSIANALFSMAVGYMYDFTGSHSLTLILFLALLAIAFFITVAAYSRKKA